MIIPGRPDKLRDHLKKCTEVPLDVRNRVTQKPELSAKTVRDQSIQKMFAETDRSRENSDYLVGMALITRDNRHW